MSQRNECVSFVCLFCILVALEHLSPAQRVQLHASKLAQIPMDELELREEAATQKLLIYERRSIIEKIEATINVFDKALAGMEREEMIGDDGNEK